MSRACSATQFSASSSFSARATNPHPGTTSLHDITFAHAPSLRALQPQNFPTFVRRPNSIDSAFRHDDLFFIADCRQHAAQQLRRHPWNIVLALRMTRGANNHFIVVHASRDEFASGNHIATSQEFFHASSPQNFRGQRDRAETYKLYIVFCRMPENSSAVNPVELPSRPPCGKPRPVSKLTAPLGLLQNIS
jgi:hypothetical protein